MSWRRRPSARACGIASGRLRSAVRGCGCWTWVGGVRAGRCGGFHGWAGGVGVSRQFECGCGGVVGSGVGSGAGSGACCGRVDVGAGWGQATVDGVRGGWFGWAGGWVWCWGAGWGAWGAGRSGGGLGWCSGWCGGGFSAGGGVVGFGCAGEIERARRGSCPVRTRTWRGGLCRARMTFGGWLVGALSCRWTRWWRWSRRSSVNSVMISGTGWWSFPGRWRGGWARRAAG